MNDQPPIDGGGGRSHPPSMDQRVTALENNMREIMAALKRLIVDVAEMKRDLAGVKLNVAEMKGRLSQSPTMVQLIGLVFGIFAASFALLKWTGHQ
jgi:hypothetical protein